MSNFYISDTHFGHVNALTFDGRPYAAIEQSDAQMTENWNSVVTDEDTVYILGDFAMKKIRQEAYLSYMKALNGKKVLVLGNHDITSFSKEERRKAKLIEVCNYKEVKEDNGCIVICSHYPILFYRGDYKPFMYHFCGHVHTSREDKFLSQWINQLVLSRETKADSYGNILNVGCMKDYMNYTPQPFWRLKQIIDKRRELLEGH